MEGRQVDMGRTVSERKLLTNLKFLMFTIVITYLMMKTMHQKMKRTQPSTCISGLHVEHPSVKRVLQKCPNKGSYDCIYGFGLKLVEISR